MATAQHDISWIAHFANQPNINGNIINTQVANHITTHDVSTDYTVANGNGNIR